MNETPKRIVLAVTGASGALYAERLLKALIEDGHAWTSSCPSTARACSRRSGVSPVSLGASSRSLRERHELIVHEGQVTVHSNRDLGASISSGSFPVHGMAICPASMRTVGAVAAGLGSTLVDRAAMVTLKERRPLVMVPRETPLSRIHLENLLRLHDAGAVILPADPAFYQEPRSMEDLGDFIAARVMEQLGIPPSHDLFPRWGARE